MFLIFSLLCCAAHADVVFSGTNLIGGGTETVSTIGGPLQVTGIITGTSIEGTLDAATLGGLVGTTSDSGLVYDNTHIGYTVSGLDFDSPSFAFWDNDYLLRLDFDKAVDANIGWSNSTSGSTLAFRSDGTWTPGPVFTLSGDTISTASSFIGASGDSGGGVIPSVVGASYIEMFYVDNGGLGNDLNFDGIAERAFSLNVTGVTSVPEPSFFGLAILGLMFAIRRRRREVWN